MRAIISFLISIVLIGSVCSVAVAQTTTTPPAGSEPAKPSISIPNPLGKCNTATCLITRVIKSILGVVAVIATLMFVWGGFMMLTSGGNERQIKQAKDTLVWAAIGIVVILVSWAVIRFVLQSFVTG